jgi:predicted alpha/beta hydrolase
MSEPLRGLRPRPPRPPAPQGEVVTLALRSGAQLAVDIREPRGSVAGTAILLHPMMASRKIWERGFVAALNEAGLRTLALDFRGHGESIPASSAGGGVGYDDLVGEDIPAVCHAARERWPDQRLTLVGHSLGGHAAVASVSTGACEPDALVLIATNVWVPKDEQHPILRARKAATARACQMVTRAAGYFPARALGIGSDNESARLMRGWIGWWLRDAWTSDDGTVDYHAAMRHVTIPVLGIASLGDRLFCTPACAARFARRLPAATLDVVRQADDGSSPPDHTELLTSTKATSSWRKVAAFCARPCTG